MAASIAVGACSGGPAGPLQTEEPQETEGFEPEPTEPALTFGPEETLPADPGQSPGGAPNLDDDGADWLVSPTVTLSGTGPLALDGSYTSSNAARSCGIREIFGTPPSFGFEFPRDGNHEINELRVRSEQLGPAWTTTAFYVSISIVLADGQSAPAFVFDTVEDPGSDSGVASLSNEGGHRILDVTVQNPLGHRAVIHADCIPPTT